MDDIDKAAHAFAAWCLRNMVSEDDRFYDYIVDTYGYDASWEAIRRLADKLDEEANG